MITSPEVRRETNIPSEAWKKARRIFSLNLFEIGRTRSRDDDFFESLAVCRTGVLRARRIAWIRNRSAQYERHDNTRAYSSMCHRIHSRTFFRCWWSMPVSHLQTDCA
jgi:hypothetical protein